MVDFYFSQISLMTRISLAKALKAQKFLWDTDHSELCGFAREEIRILF